MKRKLIFLILALALILPVYATEGEPQEEQAVPAMTCFLYQEEYAQYMVEIAEAQEQMNYAHMMAQAARELGLAEESETIVLAKAFWAEANTELAALRSAQAAYAPMTELHFEVFKKTNLTPQTLDLILVGTGLAGHGQDFHDMEQTYGVNALFAMAVAKTESGLGTSNYAINRNNYFGLIGRTFASGREGILAFGDLMNRGLYYGKTMQGIAETFCPLNATSWVTKNQTYMTGFWEKLCEI